MKIIDLHCDALSKLALAEGSLSFRNASEIEANFERLRQGEVKAQCFAIFIEPEVKSDEKFQAALDQIDYFYEEVLGKNPEMRQIRNWGDFAKLKDGEIGAMLTLEGVDAIGNDVSKLRTLYRLGVRSVGLTWNPANLAADGAGEPRGAGLTELGFEIVRMNNAHQVLTDVSHLSEAGFWDVMASADYPIASHSNARSLCDHPRNLTDEQAEAMFRKGGMIHVVFYPEFINTIGKADIPDLIRHIDYFCALGGEKLLGFGSDFDGIDAHVTGLSDASMYQNLIDELLKRYSEEQVRGFAGENFLRCYGGIQS